jgi:hypothetical protein
MEIKVADVAELVDARDLKSLDGNVVWVRVPPPAPRFALTGYAWRGRAKIVRVKRVDEERSLQVLDLASQAIVMATSKDSLPKTSSVSLVAVH